MKVKNIMFSGVMGIILMSVASSANAAISVASKAYVDTKASNVEAAYKLADKALEEAYKAADTALGEKVTKNTEDIATNAQEIEAVRGLTGGTNVAEQISSALEAYKETNDVAIADAKKAGTDAAAALETYKGTNDVAVADAKKAGTDAAAALETYKGTNDAAVQKNAEDIAANAEAIGALDSTYVSESEMSAFQTTNTAAIAAKVDQTAYDAKVQQIENALDTKIAMPAACEKQDCVLAINKASGTISWTPLTEPVADFINHQN